MDYKNILFIKTMINKLSRKQLIDIHQVFISQFGNFDFNGICYENKSNEDLKIEINYWIHCIEKRLNNGTSI